jgi:hypothetical protein
VDFSEPYIDIRRHLEHVVARPLHLLSGESLGQAVSHVVKGVNLVYLEHSFLHKLAQLEDTGVDVLASSSKGLVVVHCRVNARGVVLKGGCGLSLLSARVCA